MNLLDRVHHIPRRRHADARGWFLKVICGDEEGLPPRTGEVYLTMARPGQTRGNHYHRRTNEWFTIVQGTAEVTLADVATGERAQMLLAASRPVTLFVPAGVAHAFRNPSGSGDSMLLVAYTDHPYDPADTIVWRLFEPDGPDV